MASSITKGMTGLAVVCGMSLAMGGVALAENGVSVSQSNTSHIEVESKTSGKVEVNIEQQASSAIKDDNEIITRESSEVTRTETVTEASTNEVTILDVPAGSGSSNNPDATKDTVKFDTEIISEFSNDQKNDVAASALPKVPISAAIATYEKKQLAASLNHAPFASQPDQAIPAPEPGKPAIPMGDLKQLTKLLSTSLLPVVPSGINYLPAMNDVGMVGLLVFVVILGLNMVQSGFIWNLRRSGFRHAPRSDMPDANLNFAIPGKMGFAWSPWRPVASPSFCGDRNKSSQCHFRKGVNTYAY